MRREDKIKKRDIEGFLCYPLPKRIAKIHLNKQGWVEKVNLTVSTIREFLIPGTNNHVFILGRFNLQPKRINILVGNVGYAPASLVYDIYNLYRKWYELKYTNEEVSLNRISYPFKYYNYPEVYRHPNYLNRFVEYVLEDNKDTQYFIRTHSITLLAEILNSIPNNELCIYNFNIDKDCMLVLDELSSDTDLDLIRSLGVNAFMFNSHTQMFRKELIID